MNILYFENFFVSKDSKFVSKLNICFKNMQQKNLKRGAIKKQSQSMTHRLLYVGVAIGAISCTSDIIAMHTKITIIFVECLQCRNIWDSSHDLIHPLYTGNHFVPLFLSKHWRSLIFRNFLVIVHSNNQIMTQRLCLSQTIGVSKVHLQSSRITNHEF